jgi:dolichol-phosphate mannosyltransferase
MTETALSEMGLVIVPTYNEIENIERMVTEILKQPAPLHVLVVDDNSPDGTGQIVDQLAAHDTRVEVLHRPRKLGLGTAYIAGFNHALERGYGVVFTMDADFSHNPRYLPAMFAMMKDYDLVLGSRYVRGGGTTGCTWPRILLSRGANAFAKFMLGLKTHDCTAGFRCYKADILRTIGLESVFSSGYSFQVEMITRFARRGSPIGELPIIFDNRRLGRSKISRMEIFKSIYTILRLRFAYLPWDRWAANYHQRKG